MTMVYVDNAFKKCRMCKYRYIESQIISILPCLAWTLAVFVTDSARKHNQKWLHVILTTMDAVL